MEVWIEALCCDLKSCPTETMFWWKRRSLVRFGRTSHRPGIRFPKTDLRFRVRIHVTPENANADVIAPTSSATLELRCIVRRVHVRRLDALHFFLWRSSATQWPWIRTTAFLQLDAFSQWVRCYTDIPETLQRKTEGKILFSSVWTGPTFDIHWKNKISRKRSIFHTIRSLPMTFNTFSSSIKDIM